MEQRTKFNVTVQAIIYNEKNQILLLKRQNTGYEDGKLSLPGGHLESRETVTDGLIRELEEEIGVSFKEFELELVRVLNRYVDGNNYIDFIFKTNIQKRIPTNLEKEVCSEIVWKDVSDLENTIDYIKELFRSDEVYLTFEKENL